MPGRQIACSRCGDLRTPGRGSRTDGTLVCRACRRQARTGEASPLRSCTRDRCDRPVRARDLCASHYEASRLGTTKAEQRACADCRDTFQPRDTHQRFCSTRCSNHHRDSRRQRGYRKYLEIVILRDQGTCGLCARPVDPALAWPHLLSATLDHITPRAHGGSDEPMNLRLAHLTCNSARQDRVENGSKIQPRPS